MERVLPNRGLAPALSAMIALHFQELVDVGEEACLQHGKMLFWSVRGVRSYLFPIHGEESRCRPGMSAIHGQSMHLQGVNGKDG